MLCKLVSDPWSSPCSEGETSRDNIACVAGPAIPAGEKATTMTYIIHPRVAVASAR